MMPWRIEIMLISSVMMINACFEWYLIGNSFNTSINFELNSDNFGKDYLGIRERTEEEHLPLIAVIGCAFLMVFTITRIGLVIYLNQLLAGDSWVTNSREELK
jgi:hypothetical protein